MCGILQGVVVLLDLPTGKQVLDNLQYFVMNACDKLSKLLMGTL